MRQLIKQVLFSFKRFFLLLFGVIFVVITVVFVTFSGLYLNRNINRAIYDLHTKNNAADAILPLSTTNQTNNLFDLDPKRLFAPKTFKDLTTYYTYYFSNAYPIQKLYHSAYQYHRGYYNFLFPYQASDFNQPNINDPNQLYAVRKRGILKVYDDIKIDVNNPNSWRAFAISFDDANAPLLKAENKPNFDPQYLTYQINPLDGSTLLDEQNQPTLSGYFRDGLLDNYINIYGGSINYPIVNQKDLFQHHTTTQKPTSQYFTSESTKVFSAFDIHALGLLKQGNDLGHALPFLNTNQVIQLPIININQTLLAFSPYKEVLEAFKQDVIISNEAWLVFSLSLAFDHLSAWQKATLLWLQNNNKTVYQRLLKTTYALNIQWLKDHLSQPTLKLQSWDDLQKLPQLQTIILNWLTKYTQKQSNLVVKELAYWQKRFIQTYLNQNKISSELAKSFTLTDAQTGHTFLISQKERTKTGKHFNQIELETGGYPLATTDYLSKMLTAIFTPITLTNVPTPLWQTDNDYLLNLVNFIVNANIKNAIVTNAKFQKIQALGKQLIADFLANLPIKVNDYYRFFAYFNISDVSYVPDNFSLLSDYGLETLENNDRLLFFLWNPTLYLNQQGISLRLSLGNGASILPQPVFATYNNPNAAFAIVSPYYLNAQNKKVFPYEQLQNITDFANWIQKLDPVYKITINTVSMVVIGTGFSPENAYPIVALDKPIINPKQEAIVYVNAQAYQSLLATLPSSKEDVYLNLANQNSNIINTLLSPYANLTILSHLPLNKQHLLAIRYAYPLVLKRYVNFIVLILVFVFGIMGLYLTFLLLKNYISKIQISLAILKANGFNLFQISSALSCFGVLCSIVAGSFGYVLAYMLQDVLFQLFASYWFINYTKHNFSFVNLAFVLGLLLFLFLFLTILALLLVFGKKPILSFLTQQETPVNKIIYLLQKWSWKKGILLKFRWHLTLVNFTRFCVFVILSATALVLTSLTWSIPVSFQTANNNVKHYQNHKFTFFLKTPTEQSGLYKWQSYAELGFSDQQSGIYSLYNQKPTAYVDAEPLQYPYQPQQLLIRHLDGTPYANGATFGNLLLPSFAAYRLLQSNLHFFHNVVFAKWLLDFSLDFAGITVNFWDYVKTLLPKELVSRIAQQNKNFLTHILQVPQLKTFNDQYGYIAVSPTNQLYLDSTKIFNNITLTNYKNVRFSDNFLRFIGMIYGQKELAEQDVKFAYGIVSYPDQQKLIEPFSYLSGRFANWHDDVRILGVQKNSRFLPLDPHLDYIWDLKAIRYVNNQPIYPLVINAAAAYKFKLKLNQTLSFELFNAYDRYSQKLLNYKDPPLTFYVAGINSDAFGLRFYTSQKVANIALKMDFSQKGRLISHYDINHAPFRIQTKTLVDTPKGYVPFNGFFSNEAKPLILTNTLSFIAYSGLWGNFSNFNTPAFFELMHYNQKQVIWDAILPYDLTTLRQLQQKYHFQQASDDNNLRAYLVQQFSNHFQTNQLVIDFLNSVFNFDPNAKQSYYDSTNANLDIAFAYYDDNGLKFKTLDTLFGTFIAFEKLVLSLFIPIILIVIMVLTSLMTQEFKHLAAILKTFGFKDGQNIRSIIFAFVPILFFSLLFGFGLIYVATLSLRFFVFNATTILLTNSFNWLSYLFGFGCVCLIVVVNVVMAIYHYKKLALKTIIS